MENKHLENAREDWLVMYCSHCKEFKYECDECSETYCEFCEFEHECDE